MLGANTFGSIYFGQNYPQQSVGIPSWYSPANHATDVSGKVPLVFYIPTIADYAHFHIQADTANTFDSGNLREYKSWTAVSSPTAKTCIHMGSSSIDQHSFTQAEIQAIVDAVCTSVPSTQYIAIGSYLDYATQIGYWATAVHLRGKKLWLRSAGFNDWQGTNSVTQYSGADFAAHHRSQLITWVNTNYAIFSSGDIFECVPDEPENNIMWNSIYGTIGSGAGKTAFNDFITGARTDVDTRFSILGVSGIDTGYVHTNPSASKDVITSATAASLTAISTDDYPESGLTTPASMATAMTNEINTWILPAHASKKKHITFGPSVYYQLSQTDQASALSQEEAVIASMLGSNLDGITIWQTGNTANDPASRLFDYTGGVWVARSVCTTLETIFAGFLSTGGWEFYNGVAWTPFPYEGVSPNFSGALARITPSTSFAANTWYRRIRGRLIY